VTVIAAYVIEVTAD